MRNFVKKIPIPLSGVMLGCAALGNLLQSYSEGIRYAFGIIAFVLLLLLLLKVVLYPQLVKKDLGNLVTLSVSATFPMSLMLLSVYVKPIFGIASMIIWFGAIALHLILIVYFTYQFLQKRKLEEVFASYFIVYVGIAVAGITAPAYNLTVIGVIAFWFGFISLLLLLIPIGYRYLKFPAKEPAKPLFCIFAAPVSLCLASYLQSVQNRNTAFIIALLVIASALYLVALNKLPILLRLPFYPSFAAFTFPFVISAIAIKQSVAYLNGLGYEVSFLSIIVVVQTVIAAFLVCYTLLRFGVFLLRPEKQVASLQYEEINTP